jgi:hypothetical protein
VLEHLPYSLDLAPADFFLFRRVKKVLVRTTLDQESLKTAWEGVIRCVTAKEFATVFRRCFEQAEKCIRICGDFIEKS